MSISQRGPKLSAIVVLVAGVSIVLSSCRQKSATEANPKSGIVADLKSTNPLAYYRLESTTGSSEVGASGYKSMGGVTSSGAGAAIGAADNKCALLNGKDGWISTTQTGGITTAGSMMAWVNLAALPAEARHFFYVAGESQVGNDFDLQFETDNALKFYTSAGSHLTYIPDPKSLVNQWHMIVVTMDVTSRNRALYWDGQQVATDQEPGSPNKTAPFSIGASTVFGGRFFSGSIDEVALWNRSLSAAEVAAIYKSAK